jgi:protein SCO1/2
MWLKSLSVMYLSRLVGSLFLFSTLMGGACAGTVQSVWQIPIALMDDLGEQVHLKKWAGQPAIITMEYTESSLVCSTTLAYLKELQAILDERGQSMNVLVLSLDPKNDTPEAWQRYRQTFNLRQSNWHFLTAGLDQTPDLAKQFGVNYRVFDGIIIHRLRILRVDETGKVVNVLRTTYDDLRSFLDQTANVN